MPDVLDYLPLYGETAETVRARLDADANAGLTRDDPRWVDTREGSFYWDVTQVVLLELVRLWDALASEVPAAANPLYAWGDYLARWAEVFGMERKPATPATATINFVGTPGTIVPTGTTASAQAADEDAEPIEFATVDVGTIGDALDRPTGITASGDSGGGALPTGTFYYSATALNDYGETDGLTSLVGIGQATVTGPVASVTVLWGVVDNATGYRLYRLTEPDGEGELIYEGVPNTFTDVGEPGGVAGPPDVNTTGGVAILAEAVETGVRGNVAGAAITSLDSPVLGVQAVLNPSPALGGSEEEEDEALRERVLIGFEGRGAGSVTDYKRWALAWPGVGRVSVDPLWQGPGTVRVVIMAADGSPVSPLTVSALQVELDPSGGLGHGTAPIGAQVTVVTPTLTTVDVEGVVTFKDGFSADGGAGTVAVGAEIQAAVARYVNALEVGETVVYDHVKAQFFQAEGVYLVQNLLVNGVAGNVTVSNDPPAVARLGAVTLLGG